MRRKACERCIAKKLKCSEQRPCDKCIRSNVHCLSKNTLDISNRQLLPNARPSREADPAVLEETNISDLSKSLLDPSNATGCPHHTFAIPGHDSQKNTATVFSWHDEFRHPLPSHPLLDILINQYFLSVNWFMLVIDEDSFRANVSELLVADQISGHHRNFCVLAQLVCALGAHYLLTDPTTNLDKTSLSNIKLQFLDEIERKFFAIVAEPDLGTVQILILLGSFYVFNERPNVGYAVLGSCIKIAQLLGLHRESTRIHADVSNRDSQVKVWWALEIYEKYAAVAFGRPCGIDDTDCEIAEIDDMKPNEPLLCQSEGAITLLTYQKLKCRLYRIIGPFLGRRRESSDAKSLAEVHRNLLQWHENVPVALRCDVDSASFESRPETIQLQALALQLAYDNLQIVLHRQAVFTAKAKDMTRVDKKRSEGQLLLSANRTATATKFAVAEAISRSSHAAMHFGICLFTAGVVLCALSSHETSGTGTTEQLQTVDQIILFLKDFPGQQYGLAGQSYEILTTLRSRCSEQSGAETGEQIDSEVVKAMLKPNHLSDAQTASFGAVDQTDGGRQLEQMSNPSSRDAFQSWAWSVTRDGIDRFFSVCVKTCNFENEMPCTIDKCTFLATSDRDWEKALLQYQRDRSSNMSLLIGHPLIPKHFIQALDRILGFEKARIRKREQNSRCLFLLRLPPELRILVYHEVFRTNKDPYGCCASRPAEIDLWKALIYSRGFLQSCSILRREVGIEFWWTHAAEFRRCHPDNPKLDMGVGIDLLRAISDEAVMSLRKINIHTVRYAECNYWGGRFRWGVGVHIIIDRKAGCVSAHISFATNTLDVTSSGQKFECKACAKQWELPIHSWIREIELLGVQKRDQWLKKQGLEEVLRMVQIGEYWVSPPRFDTSAFWKKILAVVVLLVVALVITLVVNEKCGGFYGSIKALQDWADLAGRGWWRMIWSLRQCDTHQRLLGKRLSASSLETAWKVNETARTVVLV